MLSRFFVILLLYFCSAEHSSLCRHKSLSRINIHALGGTLFVSCLILTVRLCGLYFMRVKILCVSFATAAAGVIIGQPRYAVHHVYIVCVLSEIVKSLFRVVVSVRYLVAVC